MTRTRIALLLALASALALSACATNDDFPNEPAPNLDGEEPLSSLDSLIAGAPSNDLLPEEGKADAVYPRQFDLVASQSPIRNQRSRGVCSIFSTVALMEHLYIREGSLPNPDFSEQFLQWSAKSEVGSFTTTEGSSAEKNLEAINRFGIVAEGAWAYEPSKWTTSNDAACTGETMPIRCYTNGEPPAAARSAQRYNLPAGRWVNSSATSIKAHMTTKRTAVVIGGTFFYQAWNHGASSLPVSSAYKRKGYVLYPNDEDKTNSATHPAGHSILIVGWDDDLEVQRLNAAGQPMVDAAGRPVTEKGFFLFKNSWGTGSFGVENPKGDGYGWISYRYVQEFMTAYVSDLPTVAAPAENCTNMLDDDRDGRTDCDDTECALVPACAPSSTTTSHGNTTAAAIPDNNATGIRSNLVVAPGGSISGVTVTVDITHTYRGDLVVKLLHPSGREAVLLDHQGAGDDNVNQSFTVTAFNGLDAAGTWTLVVADTARSDTGRRNSWNLEIARGTASPLPAPTTATYSNTTAAPIPDNAPAGVSRDIRVTDTGAIRTMQVAVDITHTYRGDLTLVLSKVGGSEVILLRGDGSSEANLVRTFDVTNFLGQELSGTWRLKVVDEARNDVGTLNFWRLTVAR
jgi:subtilisin-like proprotein convertase family protein/C1A family cysteine protease